MVRLRLTRPAEQDIVDILAWTQERFGQIGRRRYEALISTALRDVAADPERAGSQSRPEIGPAVRTYHLRHSRERARTPDGVVQRPRHFLIYGRLENDILEVGRILHERMDIKRHLPSE